MRQKQGDGIRLIKPCEIPEVAVLTKGPFTVGMVGHQGCRWNHSSRTAKMGHEPLTPLGITLSINWERTMNHDGDRAPGRRQDGRESIQA
jgi:hypothetical protein